MATSYFECALAQLYKNAEPDGTYRGGPAYYIERGLGQKWLAEASARPAQVRAPRRLPGPLPRPVRVSGHPRETTHLPTVVQRATLGAGRRNSYARSDPGS